MALAHGWRAGFRPDTQPTRLLSDLLFELLSGLCIQRGSLDETIILPTAHAHDLALLPVQDAFTLFVPHDEVTCVATAVGIADDATTIWLVVCPFTVVTTTIAEVVGALALLPIVFELSIVSLTLGIIIDAMALPFASEPVALVPMAARVVMSASTRALASQPLAIVLLPRKLTFVLVNARSDIAVAFDAPSGLCVD